MVVALPNELKSHQNRAAPPVPSEFTVIFKGELPVRPMSARDLAARILNKLQEVGKHPDIAEESLYARILIDGSERLAQLARLTVNGEWKIAASTQTPEEAFKQVVKLISHGIIGNSASEFTADLSAAQSEDDAIELVYDRIRHFIESQQFEVIDQVLKTLNVNDFDNSVLLSVLTITALSEVQKNLPSRHEFFIRTKECLLHREDKSTADELLVGLE